MAEDKHPRPDLDALGVTAASVCLDDLEIGWRFGRHIVDRGHEQSSHSKAMQVQVVDILKRQIDAEAIDVFPEQPSCRVDVVDRASRGYADRGGRWHRSDVQEVYRLSRCDDYR